VQFSLPNVAIKRPKWMAVCLLLSCCLTENQGKKYKKYNLNITKELEKPKNLNTRCIYHAIYSHI
jgi:hypothetical protein